MGMHSLKLRTIRLFVTGTVLMLSVSLATAAIVMWIPESPVELAPSELVARNLNEYVLLHQARNAVVPPYFQVSLNEAGR